MATKMADAKINKIKGKVTKLNYFFLTAYNSSIFTYIHYFSEVMEKYEFS